jgi:hypothetical protein
VGLDPDDEAWVVPPHAATASAQAASRLSVAPARLNFTGTPPKYQGDEATYSATGEPPGNTFRQTRQHVNL